jgi:hypothetical protein
MAKPAAQKNRPSRAARSGSGRSKRRTPRTRRSLAALVIQAGAIAAAIGAVLSVVFVLLPNLQPTAEQAPTEKRADIGVLKVDRPVTYRQYLQRTGLPGGDYGASYLGRQGVFVEFDVSIVGYKGQPLPLRWSLFDAASGAEVSEARGTTLRAEAPTDRATWHIWAPLPRRRGRFFLLIQLFDPKGVVPLDRAQTESFPGRVAGGAK